MRQLDYVEPASLEEALAALAARGPEVKVIAGGTDLIPLIQASAVTASRVVDVRAVPEMRRLDYSAETGLVLGAAVTLRAVETSPVVRARYPQLAEAAAGMASVQIRNLGTVGGNVCTALPSADLAPALITLGACARIAGPAGERIVPLEEFFTGPRRTVLALDEVLVDLRVPPPARRSAGVYLKLANRPVMDTTFVGVAASVELSSEGRPSSGGRSTDAFVQTARIALGAVAPTPIRAREAEALLAGRRLSPALLEEVGRAAAAACRPISDERASAEYRREMVAVLVQRAVVGAAARAGVVSTSSGASSTGASSTGASSTEGRS